MRHKIDKSQTFFHAIQRSYLVSAPKKANYRPNADDRETMPVLMRKAFHALNIMPWDRNQEKRFSLTRGTKWVTDRLSSVLYEVTESQSLAHRRHDPETAKSNPPLSSFDRAQIAAGQKPAGVATDVFEAADRADYVVLSLQLSRHKVACMNDVSVGAGSCKTAFEVVTNKKLSDCLDAESYDASIKAAHAIAKHYASQTPGKRVMRGIEGIRYPSVRCPEGGNCIASYNTTRLVLRDSIKVAFPDDQRVIYGAGRRPSLKAKYPPGWDEPLS